MSSYRDYGFTSAEPSHMHRHFMPYVFEHCGLLGKGVRVLDIGCGNGFTAGQFLEKGCTVAGIDLSESGVKIAREFYPDARFEILAADAHLLDRPGEEASDLVISTEVVEHLYAPRMYARASYDALKPGGRFVCTTPYHGYLKNLLVSLAGSWDSHANPLWDGGHIKLWSRSTLSSLLCETGFQQFRFSGAGRLPFVWMTMVISAVKPA